MLKTIGNPSTRYGDQTIIDGNLVIGTSGKGIDFSATPGTGTSELFDDYEEGIFSPSLGTDGTNFASVTYDPLRGGRYTKIGNVVHFQLYMQTDAVDITGATGNVVIGGLPFTATANTSGTSDGSSPVSIGQGSDWAGEIPMEGYVFRATTNILLFYRTSSTSASVNTAIADVGTGANDNILRVSGTYIAV